MKVRPQELANKTDNNEENIPEVALNRVASDQHDEIVQKSKSHERHSVMNEALAEFSSWWLKRIQQAQEKVVL